MLSIEVRMVMNLMDMGSVTAVTLLRWLLGYIQGGASNAISSEKSLIWVMRHSWA